MSTRWLCSALIVVSTCASLQAQSRDAILAAIQKSELYKPTRAAVEYDAAAATRLDRSTGESLNVYGFRGATLQEWSSSGVPLRTVLYEMLDSPAAYGIFTKKRSSTTGQATPVLVGADSFERDDRLYFWQSRFFVQVEGAQSARQALAQEISRNIFGRSRKPPVSDYLPTANKVDGSETYILTPEAIDASAKVDPTQLGFDSSAEAAGASYRINSLTARLLLVLYPTQHLAKKFEEALPPGEGTFRKRAGPLLAIVHGAGDAATAAAILDDISHEFKVTWNEPPADLPIGTFVVTVVTFIAIAFFFTVLSGVGFGGLRVWVKKRYPDRVFDRPEEMELIQLKLIQGLTDKRLEEGQGAKGS
jgi:hypothetical protein